MAKYMCTRIKNFMKRFLPIPGRTFLLQMQTVFQAMNNIQDSLLALQKQVDSLQASMEQNSKEIELLGENVERIRGTIAVVLEGHSNNMLEHVKQIAEILIQQEQISQGLYNTIDKKQDIILLDCQNNTDKILKYCDKISKDNSLLLQNNEKIDEINRNTRYMSTSSVRNVNALRPNISLHKFLFLIAGVETAKYIERRMPKSKIYYDQMEMLKDSVSLSGEGLYLEFGVYSGKTINLISENKPNILIHGFDSFEGLPETWRSNFEKGEFKRDNLPQVNDNVALHVGWFDDTLNIFLKEHDETCAFIHVDCDLYSSTKTIFHYLKDKIVSGTIIVFDEYFNYPSWKENEYKAFQEFVLENCISYEYIGYVEDLEQVAVRIL